jgi:hypothetical protein
MARKEQGMSDLRDAARQALEALEGGRDSWRLIGAAIEALRAALEQPVQEPVAWRLPDPDPEGRFEWVLYQTADFMPGVNPMDHFDGLEPLYTHPPRREWRGLKEWEINDGRDQLPTEDLCNWSFRQGVYFAEKALKERNA